MLRHAPSLGLRHFWGVQHLLGRAASLGLRHFVGVTPP